MDKLKAVEKEIEEIVSKSFVEIDPIHSKLTRKWLLELKPDADKALQIAALAHDIERGITGKAEADLGEDLSDYNDYKKAHTERSAKIISEILERHGFDKDFIKRVDHLVSHHEFGGDEECNVLMEADSIAFFEGNVEYYFKRYGERKTRFKFKFMYERMSERAKKIVRKFEYKDPKINSIFKEITS